jgi:hypothetical protein
MAPKLVLEPRSRVVVLRPKETLDSVAMLQ